MKRILFRPTVLAFALGATLALGGCPKKMTQVETEAVAPETETQVDTREAARPTPRRPVRETPIRPAKPSEPPPRETAAVEPAPRRPVEGGGLSAETTPGLERIFFDFDQSVLTSEARSTLNMNAGYLTQPERAGVRIRVEGHCDERGTTEYNLALGERRGQSAFQYLMDLGVDPNRMSVVSYGEEMPFDLRHNEQAWATNRRAEFVEIR
jgi:peptidoglycan-associated lipoprotein